MEGEKRNKVDEIIRWDEVELRIIIVGDIWGQRGEKARGRLIRKHLNRKRQYTMMVKI